MGTKAQQDKSVGRILLGDNTVCLAVVLQPESSMLEYESQLDCLFFLYIRIYLMTRVLYSDLHTIRLEPDLQERNYWVSRGVSVLSKTTKIPQSKLCPVRDSNQPPPESNSLMVTL
jgi:hypothetical protein